MIINNFITSVNKNNTYSSFIRLVALDYKQNFNSKLHIAFIGYTVAEADIYRDVCVPHILPEINGIDSGIQAKASRLWLASIIPGNNMIVDIDMFILDKQYIVDLISITPDDKVFAWAWNYYSPTPLNTKWLMPFTTANNKVFKSIINPDNLTYFDLFDSWKGIKYYDIQESVTNEFKLFSDESLLRGLVYNTNTNHLIDYVKRNDYTNIGAVKRLDRARWFVDMNKLHSNYYIDCWPKRPLNKTEIQPVLEYLNIKD